MSTHDPYQQHPGNSWQPAPQLPGQPATQLPGQPSPNPYAQPTYDAPAYGQPVYGQPAYGQPAYGQPAYAAAPAYGYPGTQYPGFVGVWTYATWLQRVGAYLLDSLAILPYVGGLLVMSVLTRPGLDRYGTPTDLPTGTGMVTFAVGALVSLALWGWNRWVRAGRTGQSWGKQAVGLTLERDVTGQPIGIWMAFVRDLAHYVDGFFYLGYLWPLWDGKRQTFSDKLTTSVVVR